MLRGYHLGSIAWADLISVLADTIPGVRVVKAFAQETREIERFRQSNEQVLRANDRVNYTWSFFGPVVTFLTSLGLLSVWLFSAWRVYAGRQTSVGEITAFIAYIARFYARSESMIRMFSFTQRAAASAHRLFEILDRAPSVPEPEKPVDPGRVAGEIEVKGVRFKYGTREVLHGIDLKIQPGEMIGLVGPSGAGKSTLINLLCRFFDVAEGAILVDGVNLRSFPVEAYRRNIGIVLQDPFLFYGTIAENIAYGKPGATRDEIIDAARAARAHEFILRLPDSYDSLVGERGQSLSGGERQRVSIAPRLAHRSAHPHPRRGDVVGRYGDGAAHPGRARNADQEPHHDRHRSPAEHPPPGRPHRRPRPWPRRRGWVAPGTRATRREVRRASQGPRRAGATRAVCRLIVLPQSWTLP